MMDKKQIMIILLLFLFLLIFRIPNTLHETGVDSFSFHGMTNNLIDKGYIQNYHPLSLTGLYPLSVASSEVYLIGTISLITGLNVEYSILLLSIAMGLIGSLAVFVLSRRFGGVLFSILSTFFFGTTVYFTLFTRFSTTNRILFIIFIPVLFFVMNCAHDAKYWRYRVKYLLFALLIIAFLTITHRMAQLLLIIIAAILLSYVVVNWEMIYQFLMKTSVYKFFMRRYKNLKLLVFDGFIVVVVLAVVKLFDLWSRDRLMPNVEKFLVSPLSGLAQFVSEVPIVMLIIIVAFFASVSFVYFVLARKNKMTKYVAQTTVEVSIKAKRYVLKKPEVVFSTALLIVAILLFLSQFLNPITDLEMSEFDKSTLFKGTGPHINMANLIINYSTGINVFFITCFVGLGFLLFKKEKTFLDYMLIFTFIGILPLLINKRYVRAFSLPIISMFMAVFFTKIIMLIRKRSRAFAAVFLLVVMVLSVAGSLVFINRPFFLGEDKVHTASDGEILSMASWLGEQEEGTLIGDFGIVETKASAFSGQNDINKKIPDLLADEVITVRQYTWDEWWEKMKSGSSKDIGEVEDWMFPGQYYYSGRHRYFMLHKDWDLPLMDDFVAAYDIQYLVDQKGYVDVEEPMFESMMPTQNRIYDSSELIVWDAQKGR